jgi:pantoate--beta-alanine ligase
MDVVRDVPALRSAISRARASGAKVGFVPTMGALHEGHLTLLDRARSACDCVVLSIFVNPLQFGPQEDLSRYPRTETADLALAAQRGTTIAFVPTAEVMYSGSRSISVLPERGADSWEGAIRPGHFAGVLTVVAKLFNMVQPDVAVFGQKDLQQLTLIKAMVRDLDFPLAVDIAPIVREADGLAMSSRNRYLDAEQRLAARALSRALAVVADRFAAGERDSVELLRAGRAQLDATSGVAVDYFQIVDSERLETVTTASASDYTMLAARVGSTRLLDNHCCGLPFPAFAG